MKSKQGSTNSPLFCGLVLHVLTLCVCRSLRNEHQISYRDDEKAALVELHAAEGRWRCTARGSIAAWVAHSHRHPLRCTLTVCSLLNPSLTLASRSCRVYPRSVP